MPDTPILYVDVDSLRPDHVGAYGYESPTTPNLDAFAEDAVRFDRMYAANSPCMPSRAAFSSGRYGVATGVETHGELGRRLERDWGDPAERSVPELFFDARVRTAAVSSFPRHPSPWFYHLWHEFYQPQEPDADGEYFQTPRAETVADLALDFVRDNAGEPFFLYAQFWDPHAPYNRSEAEIEPFRDGPLPPHPTAEQIEAHQSWDAWRSASQLGIADRGDLADLLAHYDAEINYADRHVGRLLDGLREAGIYEDALIVLTADHGEEFGEHGLYREHWSTHDGTQRIPLLVKPPADCPVETGGRDHLVTNVDLGPTLADYAGLDAPEGWHGESLRPVLEDEDAGWRDRIVVDHGLYTAQRAVRTDRWKFVRTYHPGMWEGILPERALYDLSADPWEQTDVAAEHPDVVADLEAEMVAWAERHRGTGEDGLLRVAREGPSGSAGRTDEYEGV
jgi:arylsulfatase A-like enzyme